MVDKILCFYEKFIKEYNYDKWERYVVEQFRNDLSKEFGFPQGHRWQFDEWFILQDKAFNILLEKQKITKEEKVFYCKKIKF